ncbi:hypothetical protein CBM2598_U10302 [Cupriavidus taiwanensis]|uniref:Uncharacterized protein n=1 Tax=Cupriavidus taiwanensis TaxID=164546 RepID=A0A7Z7JIL0_9BURK|nr:hypothetical protein CBM2597_U10051 [Cupriavidus taiwanensis]SOZ96516.1 hypothetical protein CBM2598_U10302 [Cupriavidus taiwanensis]SPC25557.1 hypothetical protein CBM2594_U10058 [Cupriavidus taiwanensis]
MQVLRNAGFQRLHCGIPPPPDYLYGVIILGITETDLAVDIDAALAILPNPHSPEDEGLAAEVDQEEPAPVDDFEQVPLSLH